MSITRVLSIFCSQSPRLLVEPFFEQLHERVILWGRSGPPSSCTVGYAYVPLASVYTIPFRCSPFQSLATYAREGLAAITWTTKRQSVTRAKLSPVNCDVATANQMTAGQSSSMRTDNRTARNGNHKCTLPTKQWARSGAQAKQYFSYGRDAYRCMRSRARHEPMGGWGGGRKYKGERSEKRRLVRLFACNAQMRAELDEGRDWGRAAGEANMWSVQEFAFAHVAAFAQN